MAQSEVSPIFLSSAEELRQRLEGVGSPQARALAGESRELAGVFRGWLVVKPADTLRVEMINRFFDLNRRAMELLATHGPPSSGRYAPPSSRRDDDEDDD